MTLTTDIKTTTPKSPWVTAWFSPKVTTRNLMEAELRPTWVPVVLLAGVSEALFWLSERYAYAVAEPSTAVGFAFFHGVVQLVYSVLISPFLIAIVGGWLGGDGDADDVRQALAWGMTPLAASVIVWGVVLGVFGTRALDIDRNMEDPSQLLALPLYLWLLVTPLWTFVLQVGGVAAAMRLSNVRAFVCFAIFAIPAALYAVVMR